MHNGAQGTLTPLLRRVCTATAVVAVVAAAAVAAPPRPDGPLPTAAAAATCATKTGGKKFYQGSDSSRRYNRTFHGGRSINHYLRTYVPQGLGVWHNWNGGKEDLFLIGMHHEDEGEHSGDSNQPRGLIYGISTRNGTVRGTAFLPRGAHAGAVRVHRKWLYVQQNTSKIRKYRLSWVRKNFRSPGAQGLGGGKVQKVAGASFFDIFNGRLYAGKFDEDSRNTMRRYTVGRHGNLHRDRGWGPLEIPKKSQGLQVTKGRYLFSTSYGRNNRSNIYVIKRGYNRHQHFTARGYSCFRAPVLSQDLNLYRRAVHLLFEGGADYFDGSTPKTDANNEITRLHWAYRKRLVNMV